MSNKQRLICSLYALASLAALIGTGVHLSPYLSLGFVNGNVQFWQDTLNSAASRFITVDIMFVFLVVWHWMVTEARRLQMRHYGWYFPASLLIAFSATLPIFMIHREMAKSRKGETMYEGNLGWGDHLSTAAVTAVAFVYTFKAWGMNV